MKKHSCPCCGKETIENPGEYEICPVCGWEDDPSQSDDPELSGGANKDCLKTARAEYNAGKSQRK